MTNIGLVGNSGLIGNYLKTHIKFTHEFNSHNIEDIKNLNFDTVYIAAPTSNRLWSNENSKKDAENIQQLIFQLSLANIDRVILVSTVDTILRPYLPYGYNRLEFEKQLSQKFDTYILRLGALIHSSIKKNVLYDLKHQQYLDKINLNVQQQWYDLNNLHRDINFLLLSQKRERNLGSEPIFNWEIVQRFFPDLRLKYDVAVNQSFAPYSSNKQEIFQVIERYLNE